jgi:hypothetical protein
VSDNVSDDMWDDEDRQVLAHLPFDEVAPPAALEERVMSAALEARPIATKRSRPTRAVLAGLAAAALIAAVTLIVVNHRPSTSPPTRIQAVVASQADINAAQASPGARTGSLPGNAGRVVLATNGKGYVYDLAARGSVAIALETATNTVPIGSGQPHSGILAFTVDHPERVQAVVVTPSGGQALRAALND